MIDFNHFGFEYFPAEDPPWQPRVNGGVIGDDITDRHVVDAALWKKISGRSIAWTTEVAYGQLERQLAIWNPYGHQTETRTAVRTVLEEPVEPGAGGQLTPEERGIAEKLAMENMEDERFEAAPRVLTEIPTLAEVHEQSKDRRAMKRLIDQAYKRVGRE